MTLRLIGENQTNKYYPLDETLNLDERGFSIIFILNISQRTVCTKFVPNNGSNGKRWRLPGVGPPGKSLSLRAHPFLTFIPSLAILWVTCATVCFCCGASTQVHSYSSNSARTEASKLSKHCFLCMAVTSSTCYSDRELTNIVLLFVCFGNMCSIEPALDGKHACLRVSLLFLSSHFPRSSHKFSPFVFWEALTSQTSIPPLKYTLSPHCGF